MLLSSAMNSRKSYRCQLRNCFYVGSLCCFCCPKAVQIRLIPGGDSVVGLNGFAEGERGIAGSAS